MAPFVALMRRYRVDYTARHGLSVCDDLMVPEYTLYMGKHHWGGIGLSRWVVAGRVIRDRHGLARRLAAVPAGIPGRDRRG